MIRQRKFVLFRIVFEKLVIMQQNLIVRVYANDVARTNRKVMFERSLFVNVDVVVPYQEIYSTLCFLFGYSSIIEFSISKY